MLGLAALGEVAAGAAACAAACAAAPMPPNPAVAATAITTARRPSFQESLCFMLKMTEPIIEVRQVAKRVADAAGELTILDGIDLTVAAGSSLAIVGASGSGKSTLLGLLAGLDSATEGTVRLLGRDLQGSTRMRARRCAAARSASCSSPSS